MLRFIQLFNKALIMNIIFISLLYSQNFTDGFNFYLPPDDTSNTRFLPYFPAKQIGNSDFVTIDIDGHFSIAGEQIRFWGVNLEHGGNFPLQSKAWYVAGKLRKMGFNLIRFHHMDRSWGPESLFEWGQDTRHLNPEYLDRFEKLISELKKNNIFANINLFVSRHFNKLDGIPDADSIESYKGISYFDPQLIALQKEYAQQLLTHINPYTGLALVNDPVMAMVEITNENSLYWMWRLDQLRHMATGGYAGGGHITDRHYRMLDSLWNDCLSDKYITTDNLRNIWNEGIYKGDDQIQDGGFEIYQITTFWQLELRTDSTIGFIEEDVNNPYEGNKSVKITLTQVDSIFWCAQFQQTAFTVQKDSFYTLTFAARAAENRLLHVGVQDPEIYAGGQFHLTSEWQKFNLYFRSCGTSNGNTKITFMFGEEPGIYWFDDIHFFQCDSTIGLEDGECLEKRTVKRIAFDDCKIYSDSRVKDISEFYINIEKYFFSEMMDYLKNDLGVKVPIMGTQYGMGVGPYSSTDYIDNHVYWDIPQEYNGSWKIHNLPMVFDNEGGTISSTISKGMSGVGFYGKPFTISEYTFSFPNIYQTEGVLFMSAYAAFHDVDGMMYFSYNGFDNDWESDYIFMFSHIHRNTAIMALMPSCAKAYRDHFISSAKETISLNYSKDELLLMPKYNSGDVYIEPTKCSRKLALRHAVRNGSFDNPVPFDPLTLPAEPTSPYTTDTDEITWDTNGILKVVTPKFIGLTGFLNQYTNYNAENLILVTGSGFGTLMWISLDADSLQRAKRSLITLSSRIQNTGMIWEGNYTVNDNWGGSPTVFERISITLKLKILADSIKVYPLDVMGAENSSYTYIHDNSNWFEIILDQHNDETVWFGIESYGHVAPVKEFEQDQSIPKNTYLYQNYPNPFNSETIIRYQLKKSGYITIKIFNILAQEVRTLVDSEKKSGCHKIIWDGKTDQGKSVNSGIYFYQMKTQDCCIRRKLLILN